MLKKSIYTLILLSLTASLVFSGTITYRYELFQPEITVRGGSASVSLAGCRTTGHPGEPLLPVKGGSLLLPPRNQAVAVSYRLPQPVILGQGYYVPPVQEQYPLSFTGPFSETAGNPEIYNTNSTFPSNLTDNLQTNFCRGYGVANFTLHPVTYNPQSGELAYYPWIEVVIETGESSRAINAYSELYRGRNSDRVYLESKIDNKLTTASYSATVEDTDDGEVYYLIITDEELEASFEEFAEYKLSRGMTTEIVLKSWILATYSGIDNADQIRNCIIDYYSNHGSEYVLLAGDVENVPKRGLYATVGSEVDTDMAADLYFGGLDGSWNDNGNNLWGEPFEADLYAEVFVGRASVDSPEEAERFIHKQIYYQQYPVAEELTTGLMLGEDLEWQSWGSEYKEEIRLGSSAYGYTTVGFPDNFSVSTLYDAPGYHWSAMGELLPMLNEGPQLVNHLGHANNTYALKFGGAQVNNSNMTNDGVNHNYYIIYSQGCYCNSWDNRTPDFIYTGSDAIAETWTSIDNGAVCFIGNTRYGWGSYSNTNGSSQYYDREFFDALFGENIFQIGRAHQDSKEDCVPFINYSANRWCYYECCLLGDPTLEIWTEVPEPITVVCDTFISLGDDYFALEAVGLPGALCAISQNGELLGTAYTNGSGAAAIPFSEAISSTEPLILSVTKHNYYPYESELIVYVPNQPNVLFNQISVNDDEGDADGVLDLGEEAYLDLTVTNFSGVEAQNVETQIATKDLYIEILNESAAFGNIAHDETMTLEQAFRIRATADVSDGHITSFSLIITDQQANEWVYEFDLTLSAPEVFLTDVDVDDGDDMRLAPGETADITVTLTNTGSGEARTMSGVIETDIEYLEIDFDEGSIGLLESSQAGELSPAFTVSATQNCPFSANIPVYLTLTDEMGYSQQQMFEIIVGGIMETFENGAGEWTHSPVNLGWNDQWMMSDYRNFTPGGSYSWHCGTDNGGEYANNMDAGLVSPWYDVTDGATLTFNHWMNGEVSQSNPGYCYDGGIVEMKLDTFVFIQIYPVGGYNYYIRDYPDMGPFNTSQPVYSGEIFWAQAVFDLDIYPNLPAQFRFRFGSNSTGVREGWYIDDVEMTYMAPTAPPQNFAGEMSDSITVHLSWNSPGYGQPENNYKGGEKETDGFLGYRVYRNDEVITDYYGGLNYYDDLRPLATSTYSYQVTALFAKGESEPTEPVSFEWVSLLVGDNAGLIPENYFAEANYPNPFNPQTTIRFGLPEAARVKITIYNLLGRTVQVLLEDNLSAGIHSAIWRAEGLPSGIYLYHLQAGDDFNARGKMLLLK